MPLPWETECDYERAVRETLAADERRFAENAAREKAKRDAFNKLQERVRVFVESRGGTYVDPPARCGRSSHTGMCRCISLRLTCMEETVPTIDAPRPADMP